MLLLPREAADAFLAAAVAASSTDEAKKLVAEYVDIFRDLRERTPQHQQLFEMVLEEMRQEPDIKGAAGRLNLRRARDPLNNRPHHTKCMDCVQESCMDERMMHACQCTSLFTGR